MLVVGIDVGGTFTDLVLFDSASGRVAVTKTSSTANQADGVLDALRRLEVTTSHLDRVVHGTTVATNSIVQRRGVKVALVGLVHIGVQEADGDGLDPRLVEILRKPGKLAVVDGDDHRARVARPLGDLQTQRPRD